MKTIYLAFHQAMLGLCLINGISITSGRLSAQDSLADMIERCEQAVVRIEVEGKGGGGLGSGFVVDSTGIIVTNVHVLAGASEARAIFPNGQRFKVLGTFHFDPSRDICIAKIDAQSLPTLEFAEALPRKGENVVALGSPKGLSFTATNGIVSAVRPAQELGSEIGRSSIKGTWIQVDAPLSGGNSGGPLINRDGRVVAMSTLASQGSAQNLNFGISAQDIKQAVHSSRDTALVKLTDGVGKLDVEEDDEPPATLMARPPVPRDRLDDFVAESRTGFTDLTKALRAEVKTLNENLTAMRRGEIGGPSLQAEAVRATRGRNIAYAFRDTATKERYLSNTQTRIRTLSEMRDKYNDSGNNNHLYKVLSSFGPRLDTRRAGAIGFIPNAIVVRAMTDHDVAIEYEDTPYLLWVESSAGLSGGSELLPKPVFVAGTATLPTRDGSPISVTLLHTLTDAEMRKAFLGSERAGIEQWRTWKDNSGKFQVEAQLIEVRSEKARLLKRNGEIREVPLSIFSAGDLEFLGIEVK